MIYLHSFAKSLFLMEISTYHPTGHRFTPCSPAFSPHTLTVVRPLAHHVKFFSCWLWPTDFSATAPFDNVLSPPRRLCPVLLPSFLTAAPLAVPLSPVRLPAGPSLVGFAPFFPVQSVEAHRFSLKRSRGILCSCSSSFSRVFVNLSADRLRLAAATHRVAPPNVR